MFFKSELRKLRFYFIIYIYYVWVTIVSFVVWPFLIFTPKHRNGAYASKCLKQINRFYGIEWVLRNGEILAKDRGAVLISNHQFILDLLGMNSVWEVGGKIIAIVKKELIYSGPLALVAYFAGTFFIDRKNSKQAYKVLEHAAKFIKETKTKMWIFPEGTRNHLWNGEFLPFKKGAFNIAVAAQVPIIPIVFSPYYFINKERHIFNKGKMILQCLEPVPTVGLTQADVPALAERMRQIMSKTYNQLCKEMFSGTEDNCDKNNKQIKSDSKYSVLLFLVLIFIGNRNFSICRVIVYFFRYKRPVITIQLLVIIIIIIISAERRPLLDKGLVHKTNSCYNYWYFVRSLQSDQWLRREICVKPRIKASVNI